MIHTGQVLELLESTEIHTDISRPLKFKIFTLQSSSEISW